VQSVEVVAAARFVFHGEQIAFIFGELACVLPLSYIAAKRLCVSVCGRGIGRAFDVQCTTSRWSFGRGGDTSYLQGFGSSIAIVESLYLTSVRLLVEEGSKEARKEVSL
jgi:hypothetical protein